jgi:DNA-binding transcriptional ArsR family regulator
MTNYRNDVKTEMNGFIAIAKALSDGNRVRALLALRGGELCVCQIIELLALAPSTVSKHLSILKNAGLVCSRKNERWIYYRLTENPDKSGTVQRSIALAFDALEHDRQTIEDRHRLTNILRMDREILCGNRRRETERDETERDGTEKETP